MLCFNLYPLLYAFFHEVSLPYFFGLLNFWTFLLKMAFSVKGLSKRFFPEVHDEPDYKGRTALMWAAVLEHPDTELIQSLCRHGANLNQK